MAMRNSEDDTDGAWEFKPHWVTLARPTLLALLGLALYEFGRVFVQSHAGMLEIDRLLRGIEPMIGADGVKQLVKFAEPASIGAVALVFGLPLILGARRARGDDPARGRPANHLAKGRLRARHNPGRDWRGRRRQCLRDVHRPDFRLWNGRHRNARQRSAGRVYDRERARFRGFGAGFQASAGDAVATSLRVPGRGRFRRWDRLLRAADPPFLLPRSTLFSHCGAIRL